MLTRIATLVVASFYVATVAADEPKRLVELRQRFHALQRPTESDRVRYITALVRLRESFTRADYKKMEAIDAEIITHPIPPDVDSAACASALSVGGCLRAIAISTAPTELGPCYPSSRTDIRRLTACGTSKETSFSRTPSCNHPSHQTRARQ